MKKLLAVLIFATLGTGFVAANESPYFAKVVPIQKVVSHEKGYKVSYYTASYGIHTIYVPIEWFYQIGDYKTDDGFIKAEVVKGKGPTFPNMQIFWKNGKFHHLRLFLIDNYNDRMWGVVNPAENLGSKFDPAKLPDFQF